MESGEAGPIYPMEFRYRNCGAEDNNGVNDKTCHCSEGGWILGKQNLNVAEPWDEFGVEIRNAYGQFMRTGSFPANTIKSYQELNYEQFNVLDGQFTYENVRPDECDALDPADNYLWDKWQFGDSPGTCSGKSIKKINIEISSF